MSATSPRHTRSAGAPVHPSAEAGFRPGDSIVCDYDIERTETWTGTVGGDVVSGLNVTWDPPVLRRQLNENGCMQRVACQEARTCYVLRPTECG